MVCREHTQRAGKQIYLLLNVENSSDFLSFLNEDFYNEFEECLEKGDFSAFINNAFDRRFVITGISRTTLKNGLSILDFPFKSLWKADPCQDWMEDIFEPTDHTFVLLATFTSHLAANPV